MVTLAPSFTHFRARLLPINPKPPVIRTFFPSIVFIKIPVNGVLEVNYRQNQKKTSMFIAK